jgi:hypothetical protein
MDNVKDKPAAMNWDDERQMFLMRRRGLLPDIPGLVRLDRVLIYLRQQLQALSQELEQKKTKTLGESIYRIQRLLAQGISISSLGGDEILADEIRNSLREFGSRTSRLAAINSLRDLKGKIDNWESISDLADTDSLRDKISILEQQISGEAKEGTKSDTSKEDAVFVIMPFNADFSDVWRGGIQRAAQAEGLNAIRIDMINRSTNITDDIVESIEKCRLAIIDVTGNNPNVMFELGYALAKGKSNIIISQSADYLPFDIRNIRTIVYSNTWSGIEELRVRLQDFLHAASPRKATAPKGAIRKKSTSRSKKSEAAQNAGVTPTG